MSNMDLQSIMLELAKYGRPTVNQFATSATPGHDGAGVWNVEVMIKPAPGRLIVPARMTGRSPDILEAANQCLNECIELAETDACLYEFVSTEMLVK